MDILTLPCTEQEFVRWLVETGKSPTDYGYSNAGGLQYLSPDASRLLLDYLEERFGDKPEMAEVISPFRRGAIQFYRKVEGDRGELQKRHPESFKVDHHRMNIEVATRNLLDIKAILDKARVKFWLMFGTFLGAYRDGSLIPWDADTDLGVYFEDSPKLLGCSDELTKMGFEGGFGIMIETLYRDGEHTDFYSFYLRGNERIWLKYGYSAEAFETLNTIRFLDTTWRILNNPEKWLTYIYGKDWRTPIIGKHANYPHGDDWRLERDLENVPEYWKSFATGNRMNLDSGLYQSEGGIK